MTATGRATSTSTSPGPRRCTRWRAQRVVAFGQQDRVGVRLGCRRHHERGGAAAGAPARVGGTGLPGNRGTGIPEVVPTGGSGENSYGVFGTLVVHAVCSAGCSSASAATTAWRSTRGKAIRRARRSCARCNWNDLHDAWPTAVGPDNVIRYTSTKPPMYLTREVGLSSPAVVSDVVFVATSPQYASARAGAPLRAVGARRTLPVVRERPRAGRVHRSARRSTAITSWSAPASEVTIFRLGPRWRFPIPWEWSPAVAVEAAGRRTTHSRGRDLTRGPAAPGPGPIRRRSASRTWRE